MPYIPEHRRPEMDKVVKQLLRSGVTVNGDLNYVLFAFCKRHITPSYNNYKNFIAELESCAREIQRRILDPYEDRARVINGDV